MTVEQLFQEFISFKELNVKELTLSKIKEDFKCYIYPIFKNCLLHKVTTKMLIDWQISMNKTKLSLSTKSSAFINFKSMFSFAQSVTHDIDRNKNPFNDIKNFVDKTTIKKKMQFYTWQEFKTFISNANKEAIKKERLLNDLSEWNYYVFFNIAFYTGMRKGEIYALKWSDIDFCRGILLVTRTLTQRLKGGDRETPPKSKSSIRIIKIPLPLMSIFEEHYKRQQIQHNFSDDFRICDNVRDSTLQRRNILYSKGLKTIRIHDFRHSHASLLASQGINIQEIARRLGHSKVEITWNTYCHLYPHEQDRANDVFNNLI